MINFLIYLALISIWGAHQLKRSFLTRRRWLFFIGLFSMVALLEANLLYQQYLLWRSNTLSSFFLPPYQSYGYLFFYGFKRLYGNYVVSLVIALIVWLFIYLFNKRFQNRFFYKEEGFLAASSIFLVGHPNWLVYIILIIILQFLRSLLFTSQRISLRHLWVPTAIFVILLSSWLTNFSWWQLLKL